MQLGGQIPVDVWTLNRSTTCLRMNFPASALCLVGCQCCTVTSSVFVFLCVGKRLLLFVPLLWAA